MEKKKVYQINRELYKVTGIQRVIMDIQNAIKESFDTRIVGTIPYNKIHKNLKIPKDSYLSINKIFKFRHSIVIIHERRLLPFLWILTHIPGFNIKGIYVHHNEMYDKQIFSLFPKNIIAISDSGIKNLTEYFKVPRSNIIKIHNCVEKIHFSKKHNKHYDPNNITLLLPARVNNTKQQIEIVKRLRGNLDSRIKILFAGDGPNLEELRKICEGDNQFISLGFRDDIPELIEKVDFIFLFSKHEGLPISLIEACASGVPIITNSVGGVPEIVENGINGYIANDWNELTVLLNTLPSKKPEEIYRLGENGVIIYKERFTFDKFKKNYVELIQRLAK
ncbi:MAG: glycosyltransferase family 4 protein [Muribaculaceae bacterium]|nr:glycosyltransferase family 4 protein [Muribaculaceae bacterium]